MSQAKISIPMSIMDDPEITPEQFFLWSRLELLRMRQQSDTINVGTKCSRLTQILGMNFRRVARLIAELRKLGYLEDGDNTVLSPTVGARYGTSTLSPSRSRKEPIHTEPIPIPTEPEVPKPEQQTTLASVEAREDMRVEAKTESKTELLGQWLSQSMCEYSQDWQGLADWWNHIADEAGIAQVKTLSPKRKRGVLQRLRTKGFPSPDDLYTAIKTQPSTYKWLSFDWIFSWEGNWIKLSEGNYVNMSRASPKFSDDNPFARLPEYQEEKK